MQAALEVLKRQKRAEYDQLIVQRQNIIAANAAAEANAGAFQDGLEAGRAAQVAEGGQQNIDYDAIQDFLERDAQAPILNDQQRLTLFVGFLGNGKFHCN